VCIQLLGEDGFELPLHMQYSIVMARMFARDPAVVVVDDMDPAHVHTSAATSMRIALRRLMRFPVRRTGEAQRDPGEPRAYWCVGSLRGAVMLIPVVHANSGQ
jgi:hypothetical protein